MYAQALLLGVASHTAEVSELKQKLERTENKLGGIKVRLQEKQGEERLAICLGKDKRCVVTAVSLYVQKPQPRSRP